MPMFAGLLLTSVLPLRRIGEAAVRWFLFFPLTAFPSESWVLWLLKNENARPGSSFGHRASQPLYYDYQRNVANNAYCCVAFYLLASRLRDGISLALGSFHNRPEACPEPLASECLFRAITNRQPPQRQRKLPLRGHFQRYPDPVYLSTPTRRALPSKPWFGVIYSPGAKNFQRVLKPVLLLGTLIAGAIPIRCGNGLFGRRSCTGSPAGTPRLLL